ncbi:slo-interacting protein 1 [Drosophila serrata]|uniref:slo-interacting protein 1 n=1 Tax=Drosophila serrata TaxID=7274 RepID=UPI000A1D3215|nr:slo-interacting protein 1 [Drosophila serrata]
MSNFIVDVEYEYVVLKINNVDISHLPRYEAVQKFLQAKENLVVELSRQKHNHNALALELDCISSDVAKKQYKEEANSNIIEIKPESSASIESENSGGCQQVNSVTPIIFPAEPLNNPVILTLRTFNNEKKTSKEVQTQTVFNPDILQDHDLVQTITDHFIEQEHHIFEQCLEPEIDIEEITLTKAVVNGNTNDIGIYICSSDYQPSNIDSTIKGDQIICNDTRGSCENVFISGIEPKSIAQNDGRLRQGDQILRINGMDVKNKEEAVLKISESNTAVTLLVSRILYPEDEDDDEDDIESNFEYANTNFLPDDYTNVVDKLDKVLLSHVHQFKELSGKGGLSTTQPKQKTLLEQQNSSTTNSRLPKKIVEPLSKDVFLDRKKDQSTNIRVSKNDYDESEHIYETIPEDSESEPLYCSPYQSSNYITKIGTTSSEVLETSAKQQQTERVAQWLGLKSPKTTVPSLVANRPTPISKPTATCSRVFTLRSTTSRSSSSGYARNNNINGGNKLVLTQEEEVDNSSSAYNTGGSNNSASPQVVEDSTAVTMDNSGDNKLFSNTPVSSMLLLPFGKSGRIGLCSANLQTAYVSKCQSKGNHEDNNIILKAENEDSSHSHCPQFNAPNLSHYHFVSSQEVASKCHESTTNSSKPNDVLFSNESNNTDEIPMVWKVKRRPDGSRYIVKRPVRNRVPQVSSSIRKNMRYNEVVTTEEDTVSEVKIGRYWTKEERKRHIEKSRERRQQQQQQQIQ